MSRFQNNIKTRKEKLKREFMLNKLQYKEYGDCYSYIHYGKPELSDIIKNELEKENNELDRQIFIAERLKELNISFKKNINIYDNMKNNMKNCSDIDNIIDNIIKEIEINDFFITHKNYEKYLNKYGEQAAKKMILDEHFSNINNKNINKNINKKIYKYSNNIICFD